MQGSNRDNTRVAAEEAKKASTMAWTTAAATLRIIYELHAFFKALAATVCLAVAVGPFYGSWHAYAAGSAALVWALWGANDARKAMNIKVQ